MFLQVDPVNLRTRYPQRMAELEGIIRKRRSKYREADFSLFTWGFEWCVQIKAVSIRDLLLQGPPVQKEVSIEDQVKDYASRCFVSLAAHIGRSHWEIDLLEVPEEIQDWHRQSLLERKAEADRYNALSPEEQQAELEKDLQQLRGPGFIELTIEVPRKPR